MSEEQQDAEVQAPEVNEEVVEKARRMGWTDKDNFSGPAEKWVDAETFVKRGEDILPIVQANNRKLEKALERSQREIAQMRADFKEFGEYHTKTVKAQYEAARRDLEAKLETAAEIGDVEGVKKATRDITALSEEMRQSEKKKDGPDPAFVEAFEEWRDDNPWFQKDRAMTAFALDLDEELSAKGMSYEKRFAEIAKQVKAEFPHKFENPNRSRAAAVEGTGGAPRKSGKSWSDLPSEAQAMGDKWIKQGLIKDRASFLKDYQWD